MNGIKYVLAVMGIATCALLGGCSCFTPSRQALSVTASERDAMIYINGEMAGYGCAKKSVPKNRTVSIMAKKDGYFPATEEIGKEISSTGILDCIGGCIFIIPFLGLASPGAWHLEQDNVGIIMTPLPSNMIPQATR